MAMNETHLPKLRSWVLLANNDTTDFPIQNLPYGVFRLKTGKSDATIGIAICDQVLDLRRCSESGLFSALSPELIAACKSTTLNSLMGLSHDAWSSLRNRVSSLLREGSSDQSKTEKCLLPMSDVEMLLPAVIGDFTDFYASIYHATNVGSMFRPDNPLLPNYTYVPIGYHGRSSSIIPSAQNVRRPSGQTKSDENDIPEFGPSTLLDYELEVGFFVGSGNKHGETIPIEKAEAYIFGLCLLNDWSARDIQKWEYQPLGPFLSKSFATMLSPWIVTLEALEPFRVPAFDRGEKYPAPLPYLSLPSNDNRGGIDLYLEVLIQSEKMRQSNIEPMRVSAGNFKDMYWTVAQMLTHHASNGCNLRPGDLMGSGTVSGKEKGTFGSMLETTWRGTQPLMLPTGESRKFLEDGDEVVIRGYCHGNGAARIGFGECRGKIVPA